MSEFFLVVMFFFMGMFLGVNFSSVRITPEEWSKAEQKCSTNEDIQKFISRTLDPNEVLCKNSAKFVLKEEKKNGN